MENRLLEDKELLDKLRGKRCYSPVKAELFDRLVRVECNAILFTGSPYCKGLDSEWAECEYGANYKGDDLKNGN